MRTVKILLLILTLCLVASPAWGTTYYASPSGSGTTCSVGSPCTLTYAVNTKAVPGDTVRATAGTYTSALTIMNKHGSSGLPITIEGELGGGGERLAILDTSTTVTGWVAAPEKGSGVYKKSGIGYSPGAMSVIVGGESYFIPRLCTSLDSIPAGCPAPDAANSNLRELATAANALYTTTAQDGINPLYWDGIEAMFGSDAVYTYIRFRNGDNPSGYTIKATPPGNIISIYGSSYITIKNLKIKASTNGVQTGTYAGNPSSYITLDNNEIYNGALKISATGNNLTITNNLLFQQSYAELITGDYFGPWICTVGYCTGDTAISSHLYQFFKYRCDSGSNGRPSGGIFAGGTGITVSGNTIYKVEDAIAFTGSSNSGSIISNTMHDHDSACMFVQGGSASNLTIRDNLCYNATDALRFGSTNLGGGPIYVYSNRVWQPQKIGRHMYWHFDLGPGAATRPTVWFYHNSWSGGSQFESVSSWYSNWTGNPLSLVYFVNNISTTPVFDSGVTNVPVGLCSYNWLSGTNQNSNCGGTNFNNGTTIMTGWDTPGLHEFIPVASAVDAGIDISQTFLGYPALPGFSPGYFTGAAPDTGWLEDIGTPPDTTAPTLPSPEGFTATANGYYAMDLAWNACTDASGIDHHSLERKPFGGAYAVISSSIPSGQLSYGDSSLAPGAQYYYRLTCYDPLGNNSVFTTEPNDTTNALPASEVTFTKKQSRVTITADGSITPGEWLKAATLNLTMLSGGNTATVRGYFDATNLYLAFAVFDESANVLSLFTANDDWNLGDSIEFFIDPECDDGGSGTPSASYMDADDKHFIVDIGGYLWDGQGSDSTPTAPDSTWDCTGCQIGARVYDDRYAIEFIVPWSQIGGAPSDGQTRCISFVVNDYDGTQTVVEPDGSETVVYAYSYYMWGDITAYFQNASKWKLGTLSGTFADIPGSATLGSGTGGGGL